MCIFNDFINNSLELVQDTYQGLLAVDLYQDTVNLLTDVSQTFDENLTSVQEKLGDFLDDLTIRVERAWRPVPTSTFTNGLQLVSDHFEDGLTSLYRRVRDMRHPF